MRARCTRGADGRQIKRYPCDAAKEATRAILAEPAGRARYNKRAGMVEPVFAHLKENQGLRRFRRRGLAKVRLELMLHLAAYNLSRAVALARASGTLLSSFLTAALRFLAAVGSTLLARLRHVLMAPPPPAQKPSMFYNSLTSRGSSLARRAPLSRVHRKMARRLRPA